MTKWCDNIIIIIIIIHGELQTGIRWRPNITHHN
jgi:hypothetical protein